MYDLCIIVLLGRAYNSFPKMGDEWIPLSDMLTITPIWRNFFENTAMVQFDHRILALSTLSSIGLMYMKALQSTNSLYWKQLPLYTRRAFHLVVRTYHYTYSSTYIIYIYRLYIT